MTFGRGDDLVPLYEYVCPAHGHPFEKLVTMNERDLLQRCPQCVSGDRRKARKYGWLAHRSVVPSSPPHVIIH